VKVDLKLPYSTMPPEADELMVTGALWRYAVNQKYPQGLPRLELRLWAKVEDELDRKVSPVDLSVDQWVFLRKTMTDATWPVPWARHAVLLLDHMDEIERGL
jgi:hypothetical protein